MSTSSLRKLLLTLLVAGLVIGSFAIAADKATSEKQLKSVLRKIDKLKQAIDVKEDSKSQYIKQLKSIEGDIGKLGQKIRALGKEIGSKKSELKSLRATRLEHQRQLSLENEYLAEQVTRRLPWAGRKRSNSFFPSKIRRHYNATLSTTSIFPTPVSI